MLTETEQVYPTPYPAPVSKPLRAQERHRRERAHQTRARPSRPRACSVRGGGRWSHVGACARLRVAGRGRSSGLLGGEGLVVELVGGRAREAAVVHHHDRCALEEVGALRGGRDRAAAERVGIADALEARHAGRLVGLCLDGGLRNKAQSLSSRSLCRLIQLLDALRDQAGPICESLPFPCLLSKECTHVAER